MSGERTFVSIYTIRGKPNKYAVNPERFFWKGDPKEIDASTLWDFVENRLKPGETVHTLYRLRERGWMLTTAVEKLIEAKSFNEIADELGSFEPYEETFNVDSDKPIPRVTFIFLVTSAAREIRAASSANKEETDFVGKLHTDFRRHRQHIIDAPSPSVAAKSAHYNDFQASGHPLLDGRFAEQGAATSAPPIELYHPAFAEFKLLSTDDTVVIEDEDFIRAVAELVRALSCVRTADVQSDAKIREKLGRILGIGLERNAATGRNANYTPTAFTQLAINAAPLIIELQGELGSGGCDPSVQVSFSYAKFYCADERSSLLSESNCPSFLIALGGAWMAVLGGIITTTTIIQRLSGFEWFGCSRVIDDQQVMSLARRLHALKTCIGKLFSYYSALGEVFGSPGCIHPRFCPSITSYTDFSNKEVNFKYVRPLQTDPTCVVFLARRRDNQDLIVVKFVNRYGMEVHRCLAEAGFAPELLCHQPLGAGYGDLAIVVMEYVEGRTLHEIYGSEGEIDQDVRDAIKAAMDLLEQNRMVMADLRRPNVMLTEGNGDAKQRLRLIDFDWACTDGSGARYPFHLSSAVKDSAQAKEYEVIGREHQNNMLRNL